MAKLRGGLGDMPEPKRKTFPTQCAGKQPVSMAEAKRRSRVYGTDAYYCLHCGCWHNGYKRAPNIFEDREKSRFH